MSAKSRVVLVDGRVVSAGDLIRNYSFDLYQTDLHYAMCQRLAEQQTAAEIEQKVLVNIYALKSALVRSATAIAFFVQENHGQVQAVFAEAQVLALLDGVLPSGVQLETLENVQSRVEKNYFYAFLLKAFAHSLFRVLHRSIAEDVLVRGWVEVTAKMYPQEVRKGVVLIYPFALGLRRQIRFIRWCVQEKITWRFFGLPYTLHSIVWGWISGQPFDRIIAKAELFANRAHGAELLRTNVREIYTSDEFESGSFAMYGQLVASGVRVVNTAHGVGQYCPNISYTEFRALSEFQASFYRSRNPAISYSVLSEKQKTPIGLDHYALSATKQVALVLVHQPFEETGLPAENDAQSWLDSKLADISSTLNIAYFIKIHPNKRKTYGKSKNAQFRGVPCYGWADLNAFRLIFVTVNSSAFFDVKGVGAMLVYKAPSFMPQLYYPEPFTRITRATMQAAIEAIVLQEPWMDAAALHARPNLVATAFPAS